MAVIYLRSTDGSDASDGLTWAEAKATLAAALTAAGTSGTVYVSASHAETQASAMALTSPGAATTPTSVLCVDDTSDPEPPTALATTATVSTTGASSITFGGVSYYYGITFLAGDGASLASFLQAAASRSFIFDSCTLVLNNTHSGSRINFGGTGSGAVALTRLINSKVKFNSTSQSIILVGDVEWYNTDTILRAPDGVVPTTLFLTVGGMSGRIYLHGLDLSRFDTGETLINLAGTLCHHIKIVNCKLGSSVSYATGTIASRGNDLEIVNSDSDDTNYNYYYQSVNGTIIDETVIVLTGGASDGTTSYSHKMVSSANSRFYDPLRSNEIIKWNDTTGSALTLTVEVVSDNVTFTDAELWVEVEYLGTSGTPYSLFVSDRATDILATPANQTTSSVTWTTTGLTTPVKQALSVSFTPQEKGFVKARVYLAKVSSTVYVDTKVTIS